MKPLRLLVVRWLPRLLVAMTLTWLGLSAAATWALTHRERPPTVEALPQVGDLHLESVRLLADDGVPLGAWFQEGALDQPAVVLVHGNGASRSGMLGFLVELHRQNLATLALTVRAHGDSGGSRTDAGWSARRDVLAAVGWLRVRQPGRPVVVLGQSLGAAAAVFATAEPRSGIAGLWLECPYRDLSTAVDHRLTHYLPWFARPFAWAGLHLWATVMLPELGDISPLAAMAHVPQSVPVWVLGGAQDWQAPAEEARQLLTKHPGRFVLFADAGHLALRPSDEELWLREWQGFMVAVRAGK